MQHNPSPVNGTNANDIAGGSGGPALAPIARLASPAPEVKPLLDEPVSPGGGVSAPTENNTVLPSVNLPTELGQKRSQRDWDSEQEGNSSKKVASESSMGRTPVAEDETQMEDTRPELPAENYEEPVEDPAAPEPIVREVALDENYDEEEEDPAPVTEAAPDVRVPETMSIANPPPSQLSADLESSATAPLQEPDATPAPPPVVTEEVPASAESLVENKAADPEEPMPTLEEAPIADAVAASANAIEENQEKETITGQPEDAPAL